MPTIILLILSNIFMTIAWYWHLKAGPGKSMLVIIFISWVIAFVEYCFAVPANRIGFAHGWSVGQLKITQEVIALGVFALFMVLVMKEPISWRHIGAFACITGAAIFMFAGRT